VKLDVGIPGGSFTYWGSAICANVAE